MTVTGTVMVGEAVVGVAGDFVTIAGRMVGKIVPCIAAARCFHSVRHAGPTDQDQHQAGKEGQQLAHRFVPITPPRRCNPLGSN